MIIGQNVRKKEKIKQGDDTMRSDYILVCYHASINKFILDIKYADGNGEHLADFTNMKDVEYYVRKHFNGQRVLLLS